MQNFTAITELPHSLLHEEQWTRILQRYHLGARSAHGKDVLEVACGAGIGLGLLQQHARSLIGCDYTGQVLAWPNATIATVCPSCVVMLTTCLLPVNALISFLPLRPSTIYT